MFIYIMGLIAFTLCLIVDCKGYPDLINSRFWDSGESSESFRPNYFYSPPSRPLSHPKDGPGYYTQPQYYHGPGLRPGLNIGDSFPPRRSPSLLPPPPPPPPRPSRPYHKSWSPHSRYNAMPPSSVDRLPDSDRTPRIKPQIVIAAMPISYDGASLSDLYPLVHSLRSQPHTLAKTEALNFRNQPVIKPKSKFESVAEKNAELDAEGNAVDNSASQESKETNQDESIENDESSREKDDGRDKFDTT